MILLVEENPDDGPLALRTLKKNNIGNKIFVVRDGTEALDFLLCTGASTGRAPREMPQIVLLDLKLPKIDGLELLRRADECTRLLPIVILTSSNEERDLIEGYQYGSIPTCASRWTSRNLLNLYGGLVYTGLY